MAPPSRPQTPTNQHSPSKTAPTTPRSRAGTPTPKRKGDRSRKRSSTQLNPVLPRSPQLPGLHAAENFRPKSESRATESPRKEPRSLRKKKTSQDDPETSYADSDDASVLSDRNAISFRDMFSWSAAPNQQLERQPSRDFGTLTRPQTPARGHGAELDSADEQRSQNIVVCVRVRPLDPSSPTSGNDADMWNLDDQDGQITLTDKHPVASKRATREETFTFDSLLLYPNLTSSLYARRISPVVRAAMDGFNGTVFAYGQTCSGKTHTMMGNENELGVIPLAIKEVFQSIEEDPSREFLLRVSYLEIYNESLRDLLAPEKKDLNMHQVNGKVTVSPLQETFVSDPQNIHDVLKRGEEARHVGHTDWNDRSSRSHAVFTLTIESHDKANPKLVRASQLNLIDLAGSERATSQDERRKEGSFINKSLLTLGTVINKLTDEKNPSGHIPYRDSKLTRLLQTSLGGNARVAIICTVSPESQHAVETVSTLNFARRAKLIKTRPERSTLGDGHSELVQEYLDEIKQLKEKLAATSETQEKATIPPSSTVTLDEMERLGKAEEERQKAQEEATELRKKLEKLSKWILSGPISATPGTSRMSKGPRGRTSLDTAASYNWNQDTEPNVARGTADANNREASGLGYGSPLRNFQSSRSISNSLDAIGSPKHGAGEEETKRERETENLKFKEASSTIRQAKHAAEYEKKVAVMKKEMESLRSAHEKENDDWNAKDVERNALVENLESSLSGKNVAMDQLNAELESVKSSLKGNESTIAEQKLLIEQNTTSYDKLEKDAESLHADVEMKDKRCNDLENELGKKDKELENFQIQLEDYKTRLNEETTKWEKNTEDLTTTSDIEKKKLREELDDVKRHYEEAKGRLSDLEKELRGVKSQVDDDSVRAEQLTEQNSKLKNEKKDLENAVLRKTSLIKDLEEENANLRKPKQWPPERDLSTKSGYDAPDIKSLRDKIEAARQRSSSNNPLRTSTEEQSRVQSNTDSVINDLRAKVSELESALSSMRNSKDLAPSSSTPQCNPSSSEQSLSAFKISSPEDSQTNNGVEQVERLNKVVKSQQTLINDLQAEVMQWEERAKQNLCEYVKEDGRSSIKNHELHRPKSHNQLRELSLNSGFGDSSDSPLRTPQSNKGRKSTSSWSVSRNKSWIPSSPDPLPLPPGTPESRQRRRVTIEHDMAKLEAEHNVEKNKSALMSKGSPSKPRVMSGMQYLHRTSQSVDSMNRYH